MRRLYAVLGWVAAALAATGVGVAALGALGDGIVGEAAPPMSQTDVRHQLARATATARPSGPAPSRTADAGGVVLAGAGGTVVARCLAGGAVQLDSWSPAQGFAAEDVKRGPADRAEIQFESDRTEVKGRITCAAGRPVAHWKQED
ncbi:MAG TPA: hypothetical protein VGL93_26710 [Streptosporangiaceae bacterium]|jgi:hypothetical protein